MRINASPRPASCQATSISLQRERMLSQRNAVHFAGSGKWQLLHAMHRHGPLVVRQALLLHQSIDDLLRDIRAGNDKRDRRLAQLSVRPAYDARVGPVGM